MEKAAFYDRSTSISPHPAAEGSTLVQFVVDSTGAVRTTTFKVLRISDAALVDEARQVLGRWRYLPAEVNGCKVAQLVQTGIAR